MKIKNATRYPTRKLRAIFSAVHREMAKYEGRHPRWRQFVFHVIYTRRGKGYTGCAFLNGQTATIRLPRESAEPIEIACLVDHELLHSYGYSHRQMPRYDASYRDALSWAQVFGERIHEEPPKPKPDIQEHRHALVVASIERWAKRLRTAQARLRTLRAKDRYYQRALAARRTP